MSKIAVVVLTGRTLSKKTVRSFIDSAEKNGHTRKHELNLMLAYDERFNGHSFNDFKLPADVEGRFASVTYIGYQTQPSTSTLLLDRGVISTGEHSVLFSYEGYSGPKNLALLEAIMGGNDLALFLDDDEYYTAPFSNDGQVSWKDQDILGAHLRHMKKNTLITNGRHCGYFSPFPTGIKKTVPRKTLRRMGETLSAGSEFIGRATFISNRREVTYADADLLEHDRVEWFNGKAVSPTLSASNNCLNLEQMIAGMIPPFFTPRGARGEDTFLALALRGFRANTKKKIPVYTFHDPFSRYTGILDGELPDRLSRIEVTPATVRRFAKSCIGWVRYAPLFIRLTSEDQSEVWNRVGEMSDGLPTLGEELADALGEDLFREMYPEFRTYLGKVDEHLSNMHAAYTSWRRAVLFLRNCHLDGKGYKYRPAYAEEGEECPVAYSIKEARSGLA